MKTVHLYSSNPGGSPPDGPEQPEQAGTPQEFLTVCAYCQRVCINNAEPRIDISWTTSQDLRSRTPDSRISHGICPQCMRQLYPNIYTRLQNRQGRA